MALCQAEFICQAEAFLGFQDPGDPIHHVAELAEGLSGKEKGGKFGLIGRQTTGIQAAKSSTCCQLKFAQNNSG